MRVFIVINMSFKAICEKKIFAKISQFIVRVNVSLFLSLTDPMLNSDSNNMMEGTSDMDGEKTML